MAARKSSSRKPTTKKKAVKKAVKAAKRPAAGKKKVAKKKAAKKKAVKKKVAKKAAAPRRKRPAAVIPAVSPEVAELDRRIAILRNNLRDLTEMAAASSGASNEELASGRIADQEEQLRSLVKQRDALARRKR